jgi:DNA-binding CsgD family transcriptional regulator
MATTTLRGRADECAVLDDLISALRRGESRSLVLRGEAGIGKTALLDHLLESASDVTVVRAVGVESEVELAYASLHQLCSPLLDLLTRLPVPQRDALETVFGLKSAASPDRFLVGLATLALFSEAADSRPLLGVIDDGQWLDRASAQVLAFVARRLGMESVGIVFSARVPTDELSGLPELTIVGLNDEDARALLGTALIGPVDSQVRDEIIAETRGNPLALLELPRGFAATQLAGGFGLPGVAAIPGRIEETFRRRISALPRDTHRLLLLAAAEPLGKPPLVWKAASELGIDPEAANAAVDADLVAFGTRVRFRHPLVRSAAYHSGSARQRQEAHRALAAVTDPVLDPDRRAWHRAQGAPGPDEDIAAELERSADRAGTRGGAAAAAAFLERSVALTDGFARRADRALAAAQAHLQAGAFDAALQLLNVAEAEGLDALRQAQVDLLRGQLAFASAAGSEAPALLLKAAQRIEALDIGLARETYLDAWAAALFAGEMAQEGNVREVSRAVRSASQPPNAERPAGLLLDSLAVLVTEGRAAAAPSLGRVATTFAQEKIGVEEGLRWGWLAPVAAVALWKEEEWRTINDRQLQSVREAGLLLHLPYYANSAAMHATWRGDFAAAASLIAEADAVAEATGTRFARYGAVMLAGFRGSEAEAMRPIDDVLSDTRAAGQGLGPQWCHFVSAVLQNGLGHYEQALSHAEEAAEDTPELYVSAWALPELVEAGTRTGRTQHAAQALKRLGDVTSAAGTDWGLGVHARSEALLRQGDEAEGAYREAVARLSRTALRPELARARLVYGEWLRREGRRAEARVQLRAAHGQFAAIGMEAFAQRAGVELEATGASVRKRSVETRDDLTAQERQIARLARDGLSNSEIGTRLFLSRKTVEWHLHNVFTKLGIRSRRELSSALPSPESPLTPA